eukprot:410375-Prorocentrum_minimum.AAC.1
MVSPRVTPAGNLRVEDMHWSEPSASLLVAGQCVNVNRFGQSYGDDYDEESDEDGDEDEDEAHRYWPR